jgi:hypothetical protein
MIMMVAIVLAVILMGVRLIVPRIAYQATLSFVGRNITMARIVTAAKSSSATLAIGLAIGHGRA